MALTTTVNLAVIAQLTVARDLSTLCDPTRLNYRRDLADGDGAGQAEDALGAALGLTKVKMLAIAADTNNSAAIKVGNAGGANEWSAPFGAAGQLVQVAPGGLLLVAPTSAGYAVGTRKTLRIARTAAATYDVVIVGAA